MTDRSEHDRLTALVPLARAGDSEASDLLFAAMVPRLAMFVRLELTGRGGAVGSMSADDVVQETLLAAYDSFERLEWRGERAFLGWLCGIARHRMLQLAERQGAKKRSPAELERLSVVADRIAASSRGVVTRADRNEQRERLEGALRALGAEDRQIVLLRFFESLTVSAIAERVGRSESAVRRALAQALRVLGASLGAEDPS